MEKWNNSPVALKRRQNKRQQFQKYVIIISVSTKYSPRQS